MDVDPSSRIANFKRRRSKREYSSAPNIQNNDQLGSCLRYGMNVPGNSVRLVGERINGGAVIEDRSPVNDAILP